MRFVAVVSKRMHGYAHPLEDRPEREERPFEHGVRARRDLRPDAEARLRVSLRGKGGAADDLASKRFFRYSLSYISAAESSKIILSFR